LFQRDARSLFDPLAFVLPATRADSFASCRSEGGCSTKRCFLDNHCRDIASMSRRKDRLKHDTASALALPLSLTAGQEMLRRVLLALVTGLIVARPLVATEDPGLREAVPDPTGPVLTWLWLIALFGWSVWRFWTRRDGHPFDLLEGALFAVVGFAVLSSAFAARYKYAAWLGSWEWLSIVVAFYLVRRLASWQGAGHGFLAALLAVGVMLSAYAVYQYLVEIPSQASMSREELVARMAREGIFRDADDPYWDQLEERVKSPNVFATYAHPNSFAGFLGLLLPAAVGWTVAAWPDRRRNVSVWLLGGCAGLMVLALWWTHSRGAILATLLVGAVIAVWLGRRLIQLGQLRLLAGLAALAVILLFLAWFGMRETTAGKATPGASFALRLGYWKATARMIEDHPWLGVGPGNFGRHYPGYMSDTDYEEVQDPHNFALELWATCGIFGLLALFIAVGILFRRMCSLRRNAEDQALAGNTPGRPVQPGQQQTQAENTGRTLWEFYLGGMAGLILASCLTVARQAGTVSPEEILETALVAGLRSLIWFPAFALFLSVPWSGKGRLLALAAGIGILLVNLCVSGGIALAVVAQPLWIVSALALPRQEAAPRKHRLGARNSRSQFELLARLLPLPICGALALVYVSAVVGPTYSGERLTQQALRASERFAAAMNRQPGVILEENVTREIQRNPVGYVRRAILRPLETSAAASPDDSRYPHLLADWTGVLWQLTRTDKDRNAAREFALKVQTLDPLNREGFLSEAHLEMQFARHFQMKSWSPTLAAATPWGPYFAIPIPAQPLGVLMTVFQHPLHNQFARMAREELHQAAEALQHAVELGPTQILIRWEWLGALQASGEIGKAELEAYRILDMDQKATHPSRRLTSRQRDQIQAWLASLPKK
jgi:O-antigen ligase